MASIDHHDMSSVTVMRSPAADRNRDAILQVLHNIIPKEDGLFALEIASGTGQHVTYFAEHLPNVTWQPSECDRKSLRSIHGYIQVNKRHNILDPVQLTTLDPIEQWADSSIKPASSNLILCINMIHISEWASTEGLFKGSGHYLKPGGILVTYGPYAMHGDITPDSNVQFDRMLKQQNGDWGLRDVDDLEKLAKQHGMTHEDMIEMPSNNKILVFRKN